MNKLNIEFAMMFCVNRYESAGVPEEGETVNGLQ